MLLPFPEGPAAPASCREQSNPASQTPADIECNGQLCDKLVGLAHDKKLQKLRKQEWDLSVHVRWPSLLQHLALTVGYAYGTFRTLNAERFSNKGLGIVKSRRVRYH
eukprot:2616714-Pyramimonas_sp.AAC.1